MGTTSNEALHRELNRWFRTIVQMHQPTLRTKLTIFQLFKLLTHNSALYHATTIQIPQSLVASRVVSAANPFECDEHWRAWCAAQPEPQKKRKIVKARRRRKRNAPKEIENVKETEENGKAR